MACSGLPFRLELGLFDEGLLEDSSPIRGLG